MSRQSVVSNKFSSPIPKKANLDNVFNTYSQKPKKLNKVLVLPKASKSDSKFTRNLSNRYQTVSKLLQSDRERQFPKYFNKPDNHIPALSSLSSTVLKRVEEERKAKLETASRLSQPVAAGRQSINERATEEYQSYTEGKLPLLQRSSSQTYSPSHLQAPES